MCQLILKFVSDCTAQMPVAHVNLHRSKLSCDITENTFREKTRCTGISGSLPNAITDFLKARLHWRFLQRFFAAISWRFHRPCKLLAIWIASSLQGRFEIAAKIAAKIASVNGPLTGLNAVVSDVCLQNAWPKTVWLIHKNNITLKLQYLT